MTDSDDVDEEDCHENKTPSATFLAIPHVRAWMLELESRKGVIVDVDVDEQGLLVLYQIATGSPPIVWG